MRIILMLLLSTELVAAGSSSVRKHFVSIDEFDPSIQLEIRYFGKHNFLGRPVVGYKAPKCFLTKQAAKALKGAQADFLKRGLTIKVYDCYRPQRAVNDFVRWAKDLSDIKMKGEFYPRVKKNNLFKDGYIASRSGHSRGSTLDLTIVSRKAPKQRPFKEGEALVPCFSKNRFADNTEDMGTGYDCFDPLSHTANPKISANAKRNRLLLKSVMEKHGFKNYKKEWWHYTLKNEPFPDKYFDFQVF